MILCRFPYLPNAKTETQYGTIIFFGVDQVVVTGYISGEAGQHPVPYLFGAYTHTLEDVTCLQRCNCQRKMLPLG